MQVMRDGLGVSGHCIRMMIDGDRKIHHHSGDQQEHKPSAAEHGGSASSQQPPNSNGNNVINVNCVTDDSVVNAGDSCHGDWLAVTRTKRSNNNSKRINTFNNNQKRESYSKNAFKVLADLSDKPYPVPKTKSEPSNKTQGNISVPHQGKNQGIKKKRPRVAPPTIDIATLLENANKGKAKINGPIKTIPAPHITKDTSTTFKARNKEFDIQKEVTQSISFQNDANLNLQGARLDLLNLNKPALELPTNEEEKKPPDVTIIQSEEDGEIDMDESSDAEQDEWEDEVVQETNPMHDH
ncbi:erythrocyte membrane protein 1 [Sesbania bispinosa]|nr:erythrocyte membrane protein 1 [Sesbania bispinosa]